MEFSPKQGLDLIYLRWAIGGGGSSGSHFVAFFYFLARKDLEHPEFFGKI